MDFRWLGFFKANKLTAHHLVCVCVCVCLSPPQVKSEGPKLVPFFKATCVYFVLWLPTSSPSWFSALIKCLPIFCLWVFLLAHGINFLTAHRSACRILAGLIFSSIGDAFLIWQEQGYFVHGQWGTRVWAWATKLLEHVSCTVNDEAWK